MPTTEPRWKRQAAALEADKTLSWHNRQISEAMETAKTAGDEATRYQCQIHITSHAMQAEKRTRQIMRATK